MKRFLVLILTALMLVTAAAPALAARPEVKYPVTFNGHPVLFDVEPVNVNDRVFVPFRAIFEKMGADVQWDPSTRTVTATRGDVTIQLVIGSTTARVNGQARTLDAAPFIQDNRTMVPLRFVSEAFGAQVEYDNATTAIRIVDPNWPRRGGRLNLAMWNKPIGAFNPIIVNDTYGSNLTGLMYEGLWKYDERYIPVPALAEAWEWDETNTKLTFYLRRNATFFDGTPVTARDVVFTYKAIWHPRYIGPRDSGWEDVVGYEDYANGISGETRENFERGIVTTGNLPGLYAVDDYTVVFQLKQPNAPFLYNIAYGIVDSSKYGSIPVQDWGTANDPYNIFPNGNGPFKMKEYVDGQYAILEANPNYWAGRPYIDEVVWRIVAAEVAVGEMQRGTLDYVEFSPNELDAYAAMPHVKIYEFPDMVFQEMVYNTGPNARGEMGPTTDVRVRRAINHAIDRQAIINNLMGGHASMMYGPIHPLTWAYTEDVEQYPYDPDKARQLLEEAGWVLGSDGYRYKDGKRLTLRLLYPNVGNPVRQATAPVVQQWLKEVGIEVILEGYDWPTLDEKRAARDFDMYFIGFSLGNSDPDPTGLWDKAATEPGGFNDSQWWTEKSEQLIAAGKATNDIEERIEIYHEWARHWTEETPALILYAVNTLIAANDRLQNFKPGPQGYLWNIEELWLSR